VAENGTLSNPAEEFSRGEYSIAKGPDGNLYVADGQIFVLDSNFEELRRINLEERPISMAFGGTDGKVLFVTTHSSVYAIRVP